MSHQPGNTTLKSRDSPREEKKMRKKANVKIFSLPIP
jgi:hypothetical protein